MSSDPRTGFDIHVPSNTMSKALPWLVAFAVGAGGTGATSWLDLIGTRAYKDRVSEDIAQVNDLKREVAECRAQKAQVLDLLDGATLREDIR